MLIVCSCGSLRLLCQGEFWVLWSSEHLLGSPSCRRGSCEGHPGALGAPDKGFCLKTRDLVPRTCRESGAALGRGKRGRGTIPTSLRGQQSSFCGALLTVKRFGTKTPSKVQLCRSRQDHGERRGGTREGKGGGGERLPQPAKTSGQEDWPCPCPCPGPGQPWVTVPVSHPRAQPLHVQVPQAEGRGLTPILCLFVPYQMFLPWIFRLFCCLYLQLNMKAW